MKQFELTGIAPFYETGDSAGGNLAAALSIKFRDSGDDIQFKYQVLLYPLLQGTFVKAYVSFNWMHQTKPTLPPA